MTNHSPRRHSNSRPGDKGLQVGYQAPAPKGRLTNENLPAVECAKMSAWVLVCLQEPAHLQMTVAKSSAIDFTSRLVAQLAS